MASKKNTRRALFMSVISLVLCCAMLVGTTFAWFTDEVKSGVNQINAGNLDVELFYGKDTNPTAKVDNTDKLFTAPDGKTDIVWEPGAVAYTNLMVANVGTLALKYQMAMNFSNMNYVEYADGSRHDLTEVLKVAVVDGGFDGERDDVANLNYNYTLSTFSLSGILEGDTKSNTYGVVIYWAPGTNEYDNLFNMNNGKTTSDGKALRVDLGVNLYATQEMYENDSFGSDYDADAWDNAMVVLSAQDLQTAINAGEKMIKLEADIDLTEAIVIPDDKTVALNLNGKSITNSAAYDDNNATASSALVNNGTLTIVGNGTFKADNNYTVRNYGKMTIDGATVENGIMNFNDLTVESGNISNSRSGKHTIYGNAAKLTINGGNFYNGNPGNAGIFSYSGEVEINGGEFSIADGTSTQGWTSCLLDAQGNAKFTINGGVINGEIRDYNYNTKVYGGTFSNASVKNFVAEGYAAVDNKDGTWSVKPAGTEFVADGLYKNGNTYYVENANGLKYLSDAKINGTYELMADIDLGGAEFKAISAWYASSTFNGNGHTISNAKVISGEHDNGMEQASMFFVSTDGSLTVSDLTLKDITVTTENIDNGYAAAVVGYCEGALVLDNVDVVNANVTGSKSSGMLVGHLTPAGSLTATNCDVAGTITLSDFETDGHYAAKYVGTAAGEIVLNSCNADVAVGGNLNAKNVGDVYGRIVSPGTVTVDGVALNNANTQDAFANAINTNSTTSITLAAGTYTMPSNTGSGNITITGTKDTVIDNTMGAYMEYANVSFDGVTIKTSTGYANGTGSDYAALYSPNVTYTNCTFVGPMRIGRDGAKFINCTFTELGNDYIWTYGNDATFENCTFNTAGKAILIYSDGGNEVSSVVVKDCTFNATEGAKAGAIANQNCAAIEIHNYGNGVNLTTSGNTYGSNFSGEWRIKTYESGKPGITVNNVQYSTIAIDGKSMTIDSNKNVTVNE